MIHVRSQILTVGTALIFLFASAGHAAPICVGDCNDDRLVAINEIITGVGVNLGRLDLTVCRRFDPDNSESVGIHELIRGVNAAINGCPRVGLSAIATSNHYVDVRFETPVGTKADDPLSFAIEAADGSPLAVFAARPNGDRSLVTLTTAAHAARRYELTYIPTAELAPFDGSTLSEGRLVGARALDHSRVLLSFDVDLADEQAPSGMTALDRTSYRITDPDLSVVAAAFPPDGTAGTDPRRSIVLTTSGQTAVEYRVNAGGVIDAAGRQLDPNHIAAPFLGMALVDIASPRLTEIATTGPQTLVLSFSEPLAATAADPRLFTISPFLAITGAQLADFGTRVILTTSPQVAGQTYTISVTGVRDLAGNAVAADAAQATFPSSGTAMPDPALPRVVGAASTGNTTVIVQFSQAMDDSALLPEHYVIGPRNVNPEAGVLLVVSARFLDQTGTAVALTTRSQSALAYGLTVVNVRDVRGRPLAPIEIIAGVVIDPTSTAFFGSPPRCAPKRCASGTGGTDGLGACAGDADCAAVPGDACAELCEQRDADGDGLPDHFEQAGWVVTITNTDGSQFERGVRSDPDLADSDGDGLSDLVEREILSDPLNADTDGDTLGDEDEFNDYFTDPTSADTDRDGIDDGLEVTFFLTSPLVDDTDGDGFHDGRELFDLNRDPRVADLPRPRISLGDVALRLDTRFSFTDTQGMSRSREESTETTLEKSRSSSFSRQDGRTATSVIENTTTLGFETEIETGLIALFGVEGPSFTIEGSNEFQFGFTNEESTTVSSESAESASEAYQESLTTSETVDETREVKREVVGASIQVPLTVGNDSDIPFTIRNLEVTALLQSPADRFRFVPIGTLVPERALNLGETSEITSGPFAPERGPFVFTTREVFPSLVEELLRDPRGLVFNVANFDVTDEFGRNLAFISQEVNDRTAGIVIDFGDRTEHHRVATTSTFDAAGRPRGITLGFALQNILGRSKNGRPDGIMVGADGCGVTAAAGDDLQVGEPACPPVAPGAAVIAAGSNGSVDSIARGDDIIIAGQIVDGGDGCAHSTAAGDDVQVAGSCDARSSSPGATCGGDFDCRGADHPRGTCSGACARGDAEGALVRPGPNGVIDTVPAGDDELETTTGYGTEVVGACDANAIAPRSPCVSDAACRDGAHPAGVCQLVEQLNRVGSVRAVPAEARFWALVTSRLVPRGIDFDDIPLQAGDTISLAYVQDRDHDGLVAQQEFLLGSSDNEPNSDDCRAGASCAPGTFDSLSDFEEVIVGWEVHVAGQQSYRAYSHPARPDSDGDRLTDDEEFAAGTDPRKRDTDGDGLTDFEELRGFTSADALERRVLAVVTPYSDTPPGAMRVIVDGGNGRVDTPAVPPDVQVLPLGASIPAFGLVVRPGNSRTLNTTPRGDDRIFEVPSQVGGIPHERLFATDPLSADTDGDGLPDGTERALAAAPNDPSDADEFRDDDGDGLVNAEERRGWNTASVDPERFTAVVTISHFLEYATPPNGDCGDTYNYAFDQGVVFHRLRDGTEKRYNGPAQTIQFPAFTSPRTPGLPRLWPFEVAGRPCETSLDCPADQACRDGRSLTGLPGHVCVAAGVQIRVPMLIGESLRLGPSLERTLTDICLVDFDLLAVTPSRNTLLFLGASDPNRKTVCDNPCFKDDGLIVRVDREPGSLLVTSDPFEPDTDNDGLPDLLESILGSNPRAHDSDSDGLLDYEEFDAQSRFSIPRADFLVFEDRCRAADRCTYVAPQQFTPYGTSVISADTDGDGRTDTAELFEPWTTNIYTKPPQRVYSDPLQADADADGLNDTNERSLKIDPWNPDSDGDGAPDGTDATPSGFGKTVFIALRDWSVGRSSTDVDDCDRGAGEGYGDFDYKFTVVRVRPNGERTQETIVAGTDKLGIFEGAIDLQAKLTKTFGQEGRIQLTFYAGEQLELGGSITETEASGEIDSGATWTLAPTVIPFDALKTEEVNFSTGPGCYSDDTVRWSISAPTGG